MCKAMRREGGRGVAVVCLHVQMMPDGYKSMTVRKEVDPTVRQ